MEPVIKVRYKEKFFLFIGVCWLLVVGSAEGFMARCDKTPQDQRSDKIHGDNGFSIHVSGSPRKYRPNQVYTIQLGVSYWSEARSYVRSLYPLRKLPLVGYALFCPHPVFSLE